VAAHVQDMRALGVAALPLVLVATLAGCATSASSDAGRPQPASPLESRNSSPQSTAGSADDVEPAAFVLARRTPGVDSEGVTGSALLNGRLGADGSGCIAVGTAVLVMPAEVRLNRDGSLVLGGQRYSQGDEISLAGGYGPAPVDVQCDPASSYWW
jgi:hypothetical protein